MWADPIAFPTLLLAQHPPAAIHPSQENNHPRQQRHCSLAKSSPALKKKKESWAEQGFRLPQPALAPAITGGVQC